MKKIFLMLALLLQSQLFSFKEVQVKPFDSKAILRIAKRYLPTNPIIVDAGAYKGEETKLFKQLWPNCKIHAFEPVPEIFNDLLKQASEFSDMYCYKLALAEDEGEKEFFMSERPWEPGVPSESGSLLEPKEHLNYSAIIFKNKITVETTTLDKWAELYKIPVVDFLWLDLQGYELQVIKAAPELLKNVKVIYTEVEFVEAYKGQPLWEDIKKWMSENGFVLVAREFDLPPTFWFSNALFVRKELVK